MTFVAFEPTQAYRDDPSKFEVLHVLDQAEARVGREWYVDVEHLATSSGGAVVLDTDTDGPVIAALEDHPGFTRTDPGGRVRTLPATYEEMNQAQLLATPEGNAVEGGSDLERSDLIKEMKKAKKELGTDEDDAVEHAAKGVSDEGVRVTETGLLSPAHTHETGNAPYASAANPYDKPGAKTQQDADAKGNLKDDGEKGKSK
jgi:hypothetical protein